MKLDNVFSVEVNTGLDYILFYTSCDIESRNKADIRKCQAPSLICNAP
jgi:hypothetical protein